MKTSLIAPVEANMPCAKLPAKKSQLRQVTFNVVNHQKGPQVADLDLFFSSFLTFVLHRTHLRRPKTSPLFK